MLKQLFCKHEYIKTLNSATRMIEYKCYKCGKIIYKEVLRCGIKTKNGGNKH